MSKGSEDRHVCFIEKTIIEGAVVSKIRQQAEGYLQGGEVMVDENCETPNRNNQELHPETIMVSIVGGPEFHINQVYCGVQAADVDHLVEETEGFKLKEYKVPV